MAFASDHGTAPRMNLLLRARDKTSPWSPPVVVPQINSMNNDWDAFLATTDFNFFNSDRAGKRATSIWPALFSRRNVRSAVAARRAQFTLQRFGSALSRDLHYIMFG